MASASTATPRLFSHLDRKIDYRSTNYKLAKSNSVVSTALQLDKLSALPPSPRRRKHNTSRANKQRRDPAKLENICEPDPDVQDNNTDDNIIKKESGYIRFRRAARAVRMIIQVCRVCREFLMTSVQQEDWYRMLDKLLEGDADTSGKKKSQTFVTFITDDQKQLHELCFDAYEYSRAYNSQRLLTDEIKDILQLPPGHRSPDQVAELVLYMKRLSEPFSALPLDVQKRLCQLGIYDSYYPSRVIMREGLPADGIYFVLKGTLAEKSHGQKNPTELRSGDKFGEKDLICGCLRRSTVITRTKTDLFYIHRYDYREVFFMASDSQDTRNLDICRNLVIFQNFPMHRLTENPEVWAVLKYKTRKLMVKDSNDLEWIYIIKSGEARIIKYIDVKKVDFRVTRKRLQTAVQAASSYHKKKDLLDFVADRHCLKSTYTPTRYKPTIRCTASAPAGSSHRRRVEDIVFRTHPNTPLTQTPHADEKEDGTKTPTKNKNKLSGKEIESIKKLVTFESSSPPKNLLLEKSATILETNNMEVKKSADVIRNLDRSDDSADRHDERSSASSRRSFIQTAAGQSESSPDGQSRSEWTHVPPFVHIETLHAGQAFGFRACLDAEERGPSVSLVSNGCEALQINKKFFMKYADDSLISLIRVQYKTYPTQEQLIDRLDASLQWQEYKNGAMRELCNRIVNNRR